MTLGEYLKKLRKESGLSQRQLAEHAGISNTEISRIESGERQNPSPLILKSMAPFLHVPYESLMIKAGYMEETVVHAKYTEWIFRDEQGKVVDILRRAKEMYEKDVDWANIAYRVSRELSQEEIDAIKAVASSLLKKGKRST